jgi:hypothetical protein
VRNEKRKRNKNEETEGEEEKEKKRNHGINQTFSRELLTHSPGFNPRPFHVRYVVEIETLRLVFLRVLRISPLSIIPPYEHLLFLYH